MTLFVDVIKMPNVRTSYFGRITFKSPCWWIPSHHLIVECLYISKDAHRDLNVILKLVLHSKSRKDYSFILSVPSFKIQVCSF